jgi:Uma2 family endonuclease
MTQTALVTADALFEMGADERYELVEGVLVPMSPPPGFEHGETIGNITFLVTRFVRAHRLGHATGAETGYRLRRNPDTVRAPDFAFVARGRVTPDMDRTRYLDLAPDLVVEVVSPSDSAADINTKVLAYLDAGVRLVWVVYPRSSTVAVHRPGGAWELLRAADEISGEDVLPGFICRVSELFADPELNPEPE